MGTSLNLQLTEPQMEWMKREAQRLGKSPAEVVACRIEEAQRESTFRNLEFRDTVMGREVYIRGTRLKVWHLMMYSDGDDADIPKLAATFKVLPEAVADVFAYARTYADEIEAALAENRHIADNIEQYFPGVRIVEVDATDS